MTHLRDRRLIPSRAFSRSCHRPLTAPLWRSSTGQAARIRVPASLLRRPQARSPPSRPGTYPDTVGADCADKEPLRTSHGSVWHASMRDSCRWHSVHATECHRRLGAIMRSHARSCGRMREHARYRLMDVRHTRNERRHESHAGRACRALSTRRSSRTSPA